MRPMGRWPRTCRRNVMPKEGNAGFEIPADMLALAEKSVEQAKQAFDVFISAAQHAVSTAENQAASAQAGAKEVGELAMGFAERNITSSFEFARKLLQAKDPNDVMALHAEFVKNQIAVLTEQGKELGRRAAKMAGQTPQHLRGGRRVQSHFRRRRLAQRFSLGLFCDTIFFLLLIHIDWINSPPLDSGPLTTKR